MTRDTVTVPAASAWRRLLAPLALVALVAGLGFIAWRVAPSTGLKVLVAALAPATIWYLAHAAYLAAYQSRPRVVLELAADGFAEIGLLSRRSVNWADVSSFRIWKMGGTRLIVFDNDAAPRGHFRKFNAWLSGHNDWVGVALPEPLEAICERLNGARDRITEPASGR